MGESNFSLFYLYLIKIINMTIETELASIKRALLPKEYVANGYEALDFSTAGAKAFTVPAGTSYAEVKIESSVTSGIIGRRLNMGTTTLPTSSVGISVVHMDYFDIIGYDAIQRFRIILTQAGTHIAHVQYYTK